MAHAIIVTGAASGIGRAIALALHAEGHQVLAADRDAKALATLPSALRTVTADFAQPDSFAHVAATALVAFGRIDVLVNNAGIPDSMAPTLGQETGFFMKLLAIHLQGTFVASREAARAMLAQGGGAIVNLGSLAGNMGLPRRNAYGAAKAGIHSMTRSMAVEWGRGGIRVNAIAPGYVRTPLMAKLEQEGKVDTSAIARRSPLGRLGTPEEMAEAIWFLASPAASYISGVVLNVDGGWQAFGMAGDAPAVD